MLHGASGWHLAVAQWWSRVDHVTGERSGVVARKTTRSTGMGFCMAFGSCIWAAQIQYGTIIIEPTQAILDLAFGPPMSSRGVFGGSANPQPEGVWSFRIKWGSGRQQPPPA